MATRDLTKEFLEFRASAIRKRHQKLSNASNNSNNNNIDTSNNSLGTPTNGYRKLAAGGATHDLMLSVDDDHDGNSHNHNNNGYTDIEMNTLRTNQGSHKSKPDWVHDVEIVEGCIADITQQMKELQSRHAQRVGSVFGRDLHNMESIIEQQTSVITEQFRTAERLLQKVGYATKRSGGQEALVGANVQRRYNSDSIDLSTTT
jgi:hypothetical protein